MTGIRSWTITCDGGMPAFVALPQDTAKAPAVIVVHERYGFVPHTRDLAERFAHDGFVAIAPDLYFRHPDQGALHRGDAGCDVADPDAVTALDGRVSKAVGLVIAPDDSDVTEPPVCCIGVMNVPPAGSVSATFCT